MKEWAPATPVEKPLKKVYAYVVKAIPPGEVYYSPNVIYLIRDDLGVCRGVTRKEAEDFLKDVNPFTGWEVLQPFVPVPTIKRWSRVTASVEELHSFLNKLRGVTE